MTERETEIVIGLIIKGTIEGFDDLKTFLKETQPNTRLIYQRMAPRWQRLYIKEEGPD